MRPALMRVRRSRTFGRASGNFENFALVPTVHDIHMSRFVAADNL